MLEEHTTFHVNSQKRKRLQNLCFIVIHGCINQYSMVCFAFGNVRSAEACTASSLTSNLLFTRAQSHKEKAVAALFLHEARHTFLVRFGKRSVRSQVLSSLNTFASVAHFAVSTDTQWGALRLETYATQGRGRLHHLALVNVRSQVLSSRNNFRAA